MQASTEIRWFFQDRKEIAGIEKWFSDFHLELDDGDFERQDYYLKMSSETKFGLKIREPKKEISGKWKGKLEAKILIKELAAIELENGNSGRANQWTKFSFSLQAGEETLEEIMATYLHDNYSDNDDAHWIKMEKNRILLKYDIEQKKFIKGEVLINEGCGIELTAIRINDNLYYTFGLEAFSVTGRHEQNFFETLHYVFSKLKVPFLSTSNSLTYPEFLSANT
jgi:hypothetical protein